MRNKNTLAIYLLLLFYVCLFAIPVASAQDIIGANIPQVTPMSPNAAALYKVLERPLGSYTGTVPISFPLLTLHSGKLSTSLALNYNSTGGIRVEEMASNVGLGFSLADGGGSITEVIHGPLDLQPGYGRAVAGSRKPSKFDYNNIDSIITAMEPMSQDLEPDEFYYNFNGKSGKFILKEDGTVDISENSGLKIQYYSFGSVGESGIGGQWIITDAMGNKYYFGHDKNNTKTYNSVSYFHNDPLYVEGTAGGSHPPTTEQPSSISWYLVEVRDMNEENTLTYTYTDGGAVFDTYGGGLKNISGGLLGGNGTYFNLQPEESFVHTRSEEYLVSRIDSKEGYVLISSKNMQWGPTTYGDETDSISYYDLSGQLKKKYRFNYGYFDHDPNDADLRLKLNSFSEVATNGIDSLVYRFDYNTTVHLPSRNSYSVDIWGFYNGQQGNTSFFPNFYAIGIGRDVSESDRTANPNYAQANILTKITYPTKGTREFIYEGNTALMDVSDQQRLESPANNITRIFEGTYQDFQTSPSGPYYRHIFTINNSEGSSSFQYILDNVDNSCGGYTVKIYRLPADSNATGTLLYTYSQPLNNVQLSNGNYRLEVYSGNCTITGIEGSWEESTLSTAVTTPYGDFSKNNINVGGVRVKQINDYDPVTNKTNTTVYKYNLYSTDSTLTSGLLITPLVLASIQNQHSISGLFWGLYTSSSYPLATQGSSYVVYPEVRTIENGNGWTDEQFSYLPDELNYGYPIAPSLDNSHYRGDLLCRKEYNQSGNLLRKTTYSYIDGYYDAQIGVRFKPYYNYGSYDTEAPILTEKGIPILGWYDIEIPSYIAYNQYSIPVASTLLSSTTDSLFSPSGVYVTNTDNDFVSYDNHQFLEQSRVQNSKGQTHITTYHYPFTPSGDFTFGLTSAEQNIQATLLQNNYLQPMEKVDSLEISGSPATLLDGTKLTMGNFNSGAINLALERVYSSPTGYRDTHFSGYDLNGNLTETYPTDGVKDVYLWGYNGQYPVAKITGSDFNTVNAHTDTSVLNHGTEAQIEAQLTSLRNYFTSTPLVQVTTYTYAPLIGMTSETDPKGYTIYYEYDGFGRLMDAKDKDGNVVKKYDYHYQGQ